MEKVIFDTNSVRNTEPKKFLGGRSELERFAKVAEIIIPDMVIGEIRNQKRVALTSKKQSFLNNPFHWLRDLNDDETKGFDIEVHIPDMDVAESFEKIVKPTMDKVLNNVFQIKTLSKTRDTLLPKLMSGQVRVKA